MDNQEQRDFLEEAYYRDYCPGCDNSPCSSPNDCDPDEDDNPCDVVIGVDTMGESVFCDGSCVTGRKRSLPPMSDGNVIGYFDVESGNMVLDGGEWWNNR